MSAGLSLLVGLLAMTAALLGPFIYESHRANTWRALAARRGLRFYDHNKGSISGVWGGVQVSVDAEVYGWGKSRHIRTTLQVSYPGEVPHDLSMTPENLVNKLGKLIGGQDIQTGDAELDRAFIIRGAFEEEVATFVRQPRVRAALLAIARRYPSMRFDRMGIHIMEQRFWSAERVEEALDLISGHMRHMADTPRLSGDAADQPAPRGAGW